MKRFYYSIASGSVGNCGLYVVDNTAVLIDLGVSVRALQQALSTVGLAIADLTAVLITHEHTDHVKGLATFLKKFDIPIYATAQTVQQMISKLPQAEQRIHTFRGGEQFPVGALTVTSFLTPHDAAESVGYVLRHACGAFGFATDLGYLSEKICRQLQGCDAVVLESNHDRDMVAASAYPWSLKQRILGGTGHLSNMECAQAASFLAKHGTYTFILAHLSEQNNKPTLAYRQTKEALEGQEYSLYVAPKGAMEQPVWLTQEARACCL